MAIVADGKRGRICLPPTQEHEATAASAQPAWEPEVELFAQALGFRIPAYGLTRWADLFTPRQLVALTTFSDLVGEARIKALADARVAGFLDDATALHDDGRGAVAYADAVATYLALAVDRSAMGGNSLTRWNPVGAKAQHAFGRQALPMIWDFAETNLLGEATGSLDSGYEMAVNGLLLTNDTVGAIKSVDAQKNSFSSQPVVISTDPPYYDNVGYADLSDFFCVWLKRSLGDVWPDLFRRLTTPKQEELVATPHRHGGKQQAEAFFMHGMSEALTAMRQAATDGEPVAIYYAFKQSEMAEDASFRPAGLPSCRPLSRPGLVSMELGHLERNWPLGCVARHRMPSLRPSSLSAANALPPRKPSPAPISCAR